MDYMCSCVFKSMCFSNLLWMFNVNAGYSGLQSLDDIYYTQYNTTLAVQLMGFVLLLDQDLPFSLSAQTDPGKPGDYDKEMEALGFNIESYYRFSKKHFMKTALVRVFFWSVYSVYAGAVCYFVPYWAYGLGIANKSGKTEDLWTISLAMIITNVLMHHGQLIIQIRNYTWLIVAAAVFSLSWLPISILMVEYWFGTVLL